MKKIICVLLVIAIVSALSVTLFACTPRSEILKLYMPGEYIDEDIFEDFEAWYLENTGKKVKVKIETFKAVEDIHTAVEGSRADYDLLCPSDYMVEYLIKKDLVIPYDKNIVGSVDATRFVGDYVELAKLYDPELKYAIPYMYGTLGLVYDITKTNGTKITSWDALFGDSYRGHRSVKKSMRDAYAAACLYNNGKLAAGDRKSVQAVFEDTSAATVASAKSALLAVKSGSEWDTDNVKFEMAANDSNVTVALMWSCDAGYVMNDYEDEDGNEQEGNRNLWYVVPDEGGNVYIDNFVISKYAVNVDAANWFLKYICQKDVAIKNSEYSGTISVVKDAYDELYASYVEDEDGMFEGVDEAWVEMFIETMFPSEETLARCGVMRDYGQEGQDAVSSMWGAIVG